MQGREKAMADIGATAARLWDIHKEYLIVQDERNVPGFKYTPGWQDTTRILRKKARNVFTDMIHAWTKERHIEANIRSEFVLDKPSEWSLPISIHLVSIYNSKGQIGERPRWLNKISVSVRRFRNNGVNVRLVSHMARTDPDFLSPLDKEFHEFITEFVKALYPGKNITAKQWR